MKLVTGFLTWPNLTDEIWFLPKFRKSIYSFLLFTTSCLFGNPRQYKGLRTPQGKGWSGRWPGSESGGYFHRYQIPSLSNGIFFLCWYLHLSNYSVSFTGVIFFPLQKWKPLNMTQITLLAAQPCNLDQRSLFKLYETRRNKNKEKHVVVWHRECLDKWRLNYYKVCNLVHMFKERK